VSPRSSSDQRRTIRGLIATLRVARIVLWGPLSSSSLGDEKRVSSLVLRSAAPAEVVLAAVGGEGC
jgi:hypothetical protein